MNKFEKQLEKWNNGILRGAQAKLAKALGVSSATTALWATGKRRPSKGYAAQMAHLFGLDVYGVLRLFEPRSVVYPTPAPTARTLHEHTSSSKLYPAAPEFPPQESNTVTLPFLNTVPAAYPLYNEEDIIEWWRIPRRYAAGAKYIIRCADVAVPNVTGQELCLIKPSTQYRSGEAVLCQNAQGHFILLRATEKAHKTQLHYLDGSAVSATQALRVLGIAVRRIGNF